jgi:glycosyltransferase involved in cell wall biosynthesis
VIASVARQYPRKNTSSLIRAMPRVVDAVPGVRLRVIGDGPERRRLAGLVARLGLEETVDLPGSLPGAEAVREELARATVFCLPSRQEGFGIVFLEAMAAGLAIVAADRGAVPEVAPHGEVALLVDPDDVDGLADALIRLLREPDLRRRLVAGGTKRWQRYDWTHVARLFLAEVGRR